MLVIKSGTTHKPVQELAPSEDTTIHLRLEGDLRRSLSQVALGSNHSMSSLIQALLQKAVNSGVMVTLPGGVTKWVP